MEISLKNEWLSPRLNFCNTPRINLAFGTIILGAGRSVRMGRPKMLLPWGDSTILGHLISQWQKLGSKQVAVVHGPDPEIIAELVRPGFPQTQRIQNPAPERGMFSSIQCAANWGGWETALTHWALVLGDQPHLRETTLRQLLDFAGVHSGQVCQPEWKLRPKHPVVLPAITFGRLRSSSCSNLKDFLKSESAKVALLKFDDPGLEWDIDYPADYERLRPQFGIPAAKKSEAGSRQPR